MKNFKALAALAALALASTAVPVSAAPLKNIVLVHGAWVDASGWKPVYEILTNEGFKVTMVQEPETSFPDDVAAAKRVLDLQDGPTLLVGHSYGGSIITEAGVHPNVAGLVYVAAHAPDAGEDESALGKKTPPYLDMAPLVRRLHDAYGRERLMRASDCPFQVQEGHTYANSIALIRDRLDFLTSEDKNWMLRKTAEKVFFS